MHMYGHGTRASCNTGVDLYKRVAERGIWASDLKTAHYSYLEGEHERAVALYARLAEEGFKIAQINSAYLISEGIGYYEANSQSVALILWQHAAEQEDPAAQRMLGDYYYYGLAGQTDYRRAVDFYRQAADKRDAQSIFNLGYMYQFGIGVEQDFPLAKRYYDQSIEISPDAYYPCTIAIYGLKIHRWVIRCFGDLLGVDSTQGDDPISSEETQTVSTSGTSKSQPPSSGIKDNSNIEEPSILDELKEVLGEIFNIEDILLEDIILFSLCFILGVIIFLRQHRREPEGNQQNAGANPAEPQPAFF